MAWTDILFAEGDRQNFVVELPAKAYAGVSTDFLFDQDTISKTILEVTLYKPKGRVIKGTLATRRSGTDG